MNDSVFVVFSYFVPEVGKTFQISGLNEVPCFIQLYIQFKQAQYIIQQAELRPWERNSLLIKE